jgi:hypothetical protein
MQQLLKEHYFWLKTEIKLASQIDPTGTGRYLCIYSGDYATYNYTGAMF